MRLIDADALIEHHCEGCSHEIREGCKTDPVCATLLWLVEAPTIEAEHVVHGRWVIITDEFDCEMMECSCCGAEFYDGDNDTVDCLHNYCPNCGAKMDGGADHERS